MTYSIMMPCLFSGADHETDIVVLLLTMSVKLRGVDGAVFVKSVQKIVL